MKIYSVLLALMLVGCAVFTQAAKQEPEVPQNDEIDKAANAPPPTVYLTMRIIGSVLTNRRYCYCFEYRCYGK